MRVGIVYARFWPSIGGVETHLYQLARGLVRRGHEVIALAPVNDQGNANPYRISVFAPRLESQTLDGIAFRGLNPTLLQRARALPTLVYYLPRIRRWYYQQLLGIGIRNYRRVFGPHLAQLLDGVDLIHCAALNHLGWATHDAAEQIGCPFVLQPFVHPGQYGDDPPNLELARQASQVISLVEAEQAFYVDQQVPAARVSVIGVSPNLDTVGDATQFRQQHAVEGPLVAFIGRQSNYKGLPELVDACRLLQQSHPTLRLAVAGPAADDFQLPAEPWLLNLARVDETTKASLLTACDLLCLPSRHEILPTVVLEAWSLGKPVVVGDIAYLRSLVRHEQDGLLVAHEPGKIAAAIGRIIDDPTWAAKLGQAGKQRVEQEFTREVVIDRTEALYQRLLRLSSDG